MSLHIRSRWYWGCRRLEHHGTVIKQSEYDIGRIGNAGIVHAVSYVFERAGKQTHELARGRGRDRIPRANWACHIELDHNMRMEDAPRASCQKRRFGNVWRVGGCIPAYRFRLGYGILADENGHQPSWVISVRSTAGDVAETDRTRAVNYVCHKPAVAVTLVSRRRRDETDRRLDQSTAYRVHRGQYCRHYARAG